MDCTTQGIHPPMLEGFTDANWISDSLQKKSQQVDMYSL